MVDWERVERLRSKGRNWRTIARDPKVRFTPPDGVEDRGKALKTLYYTHRSLAHPTSNSAPSTTRSQEPREHVPITARGLLVPAGLLVSVAGALWLVFALEVAEVGRVVPAIPYVLLVVAVGAILLGVAMVRRTGPLDRAWRKPVAAGIVLGLVIPGALALAAGSLGVPNLTPAFAMPNAQGWLGTHNAVWTGGSGLPVLLIVGSIACPYCASSNWAFYEALQAFGSVSGTYASHSLTGYLYSNTPELALDSASVSSRFLSWEPKMSGDTQSIHLPGLSATEDAYYSHYHESGAIPFLVVVGGIYLRTTALVDPGCLFTGGCGCDYSGGACGSPLSVAQVQSALASKSGSIYDAVHGGAIYLEACLVKADQIAGTTPPALPPEVMSLVPSILY